MCKDPRSLALSAQTDLAKSHLVQSWSEGGSLKILSDHGTIIENFLIIHDDDDDDDDGDDDEKKISDPLSTQCQ